MAYEPLAMTPEDAITKLSAHSDLDGRGTDILAAATTLRDSMGRDRHDALRSMCSAWGVDRREKISGKWKNRRLPVLEALLKDSVCLAAARWQPNSHGQPEQLDVPEQAAAETAQHDARMDGEEFQERGVPEDAASETALHDALMDGEESQERGVAEHASASASSVAPLDGKSGGGNADHPAHVRDDASPSHAGSAKKPRTATAEPMQAAGSSAPSRAGHEPRILPLPITQDDVISLRRLGPDLFEATTRSGELWIGDAVLLETLPQGGAKLATLKVTECMNAREAKAKREHNAANATNADSRSTEPPEKKARTLQENSDRRH